VVKLLVQSFGYSPGEDSAEAAAARTGDGQKWRLRRHTAAAGRVGHTVAVRTHADEMHILRDDFPERHRHPTKTSIKNGMEWLMHNIRPGSSLFFYFSGEWG
jgi:hypothetical protein